jgi:hypothetical protein
MASKQKLHYANFIVLPLVVFSLAPGTHDPNGIPKLVALIIGSFMMYIINYRNLYIKFNLAIFPWLLVCIYGIIQLAHPIDLQVFLLGTFMRNGGYFAIISLALIFTIVSNLPLAAIEEFQKCVLVTHYGLLAYGFLEISNLLPYQSVNKYQNSLTLTLTNPNFTSAYLGTSIAAYLCTSIFNKRNQIIKHFIVLGCTIFLLYKTESLQGYLILLISFLIFGIYWQKEIVSFVGKFKLNLLAIVILLLLAFNFKMLLDWLTLNGSIRQRFSYWRLSIRIWKDNPFFGIGLDNIRNYSTKYRDLSLVKQEGIFTAPDRSHNVLIDHFVNGGIFAGICWLTFILVTSYFAIRNLNSNKQGRASRNYLFIVIIWFSYLVQSLISVDHLALTLLGYISAGFIIGNTSSSRQQSVVQRKSVKKWVIKIQIFAILLFTLFFLVYSIFIIKFEYYSYQYLYKNNSSVLNKIYNSKVIVPQTLEDVTVKISQTKDFEGANYFAIKLLDHSPSSHQAYYIKSVYLESKNDIYGARNEMLKALKIDKFNSVYLLAMSIFEFNLGDKFAAQQYLAKTIAINPNQQGVDIVSKLISGSKK